MTIYKPLLRAHKAKRMEYATHCGRADLGRDCEVDSVSPYPRCLHRMVLPSNAFFASAEVTQNQRALLYVALTRAKVLALVFKLDS